MNIYQRLKELEIKIEKIKSVSFT